MASSKRKPASKPRTRTATPTPKKNVATRLQRSGKPVTKVSTRMYCLGTGDCFVLTFSSNEGAEFNLLIDCGSCRGEPADFQPYLDDLMQHVQGHVDLLVVTHEHNDHVNGFAKCPAIFEKLSIGQAWFAWTEDPDDPTGAAKELQAKRKKMKKAFANALGAMERHQEKAAENLAQDFYNQALFDQHNGFLKGLHTLADVNLGAVRQAGQPLAGMVKIKTLLETKGVTTKYLYPGETIQLPNLPGFRFHILGPPTGREYIFKNGKEGVDVYHKRFALEESSLAANAFLAMDSTSTDELPFAPIYVVDRRTEKLPEIKAVLARYKDPEEEWRTIDQNWLHSAGTLALRLNSHINNTSLAMAIESTVTKKVFLFPGDAEYGSWASWHEIEKWKPKKQGEKHFVEELLNRTVFYKVGHHLSYNGTALQKGIMMMESNELAAMATLDRQRISEGWKATMPNRFLLQELLKRCQGKVFIMDEFEVDNRPSGQLDPASLGVNHYRTGMSVDKKRILFKEYTVNLE